jgi:hypothetical protein
MIFNKPSDEHAAIVSGKLNLSDASPAVQSWFRLYIYKNALRIARSGTDKEIIKHAETYRDRLEKAVNYIKKKGIHNFN